MPRILLVFVVIIGILATLVHSASPSPFIANPRLACQNIHDVYNLAIQKDSYITCNGSLWDLVVPSFYGRLNLCPPGVYSSHDWWMCIGDCILDTPVDPAWKCNITIPNNWAQGFGKFELRLQFYDKGLSGPAGDTSIANITVINTNASTICPPGQALQKNSYCELCPVGTFSSNGTKCTTCPIGTQGLSLGAPYCPPCQPGWYGSGGSNRCQYAPVGYYSEGNVFRSSACPPGTYAPESGSFSCIPCPAGTTSCAGASSCSPCPAGKISTPGSFTCTPCPPGTYAPYQRSTICRPCPANTYSSTLAATSSSSCRSCPSGTTLQPGCVHASECCV